MSSETLKKEIMRLIGNERLYNKFVIIPLYLEILGRITNDKTIKEVTKKLYKVSRDLRAFEEFLNVYFKTGKLDIALERAMFKVWKRYAGTNQKV